LAPLPPFALADTRANRLPVVTRDGDFRILAGLGLIELIQV